MDLDTGLPSIGDNRAKHGIITRAIVTCHPSNGNNIYLLFVESALRQERFVDRSGAEQCGSSLPEHLHTKLNLAGVSGLVDLPEASITNQRSSS
jgi:hypothetical protein